MSINSLAYGGASYDDEIDVGGSLNMSHAMVGETLAIDELIIPLLTEDIPERLLASDMDPNDMIRTADGVVVCAKKGAPTPQFIKNGAGQYYFGDDLVGQYYLDEMHQTGMHENLMRFLSAIRLLDRSDHHGGLYTGQTAGTIIDDVIGDVVSYTIDTDIAAIQLYGYLPYARRRNNLMLIMLAIGAAIKNAADGSLRITQLSSTVTGVFDESRVFIGGTVPDKIPATAVQVTEHNYLASNETVELFNDSTISTETVIFTEPYHDLAITGGTITASGVNFCTFTGSGAVVLTGKKYTHVTRVITVGTAPTGIDSDVVRSVPNNTLLTPNNAVIVAEKLFDYLKNAQSIKQEVVFGTERPGDVVSVVHPYTRQLVEACVKSMQIQFGKTELRAVCEFLVGYVPAGATAGFQNYVVLTGSGTWAVPAGVTRIRAILVGGGNGGSGGYNGTNSVSGTSGLGGAGGAAGDAGLGALILEMNLIVTPGNGLTYVCGEGGVGGPAGIIGSEGTATTFGTLSSLTGRRYPFGYAEPKSGLSFADNGDEGVDGGNGGSNGVDAEDVVYNGITYTGGENGDAVFNAYYNKWAYGSGGGGAAAGANGQDGTDGYFVSSTPYHGIGGDGANAADGVDASRYGEGGGGGNGGGGGGFSYNNAGTGGTGGTGGNGGNGAIIIYY